MQLYSRKESIERMNDLAGKGRPFLFIIDYKQEHSYVEEISEIDSSFCQYSFYGITNVEKRSEEYDFLSGTTAKFNRFKTADQEHCRAKRKTQTYTDL